MILDTGTLIGIVIALAGSLIVMGLFWKQNIALSGSLGMMLAMWQRNVKLEKEIRRLQIVLRTERLLK